MPCFNRLVGIGAAALSAVALYACHTPPSPSTATFSVNQVSQNGVVGTALLASAADSAALPAAPYPPPPKRAEIPPPAPSARALWQVGHWSWDGSKYVWARGRYLERPAPTSNWRPGYWRQQQDGWVWVAGRWTS